MNGNGSGRNGHGSSRNGSDGAGSYENLRHRFERQPGVSPISPEHGCYGCLIAGGLILVTLLVWAFIYYYNEPNFHPPAIDESVPTVQEQLQDRIKRAKEKRAAASSAAIAASPTVGASPSH